MQKRQYWLEGSPNEAELEGQPWKGRFRKGFSLGFRPVVVEVGFCG